MILSHIDRFDYVPTRVYWNNKMFSFVFKRVWMYWAMHQCWTVKRHAERCHHMVQLNTPITCKAHLAVTLDHPHRFQKYSLFLMFIKANQYVKFRPRKRAKKPTSPSAGKDNFVRFTNFQFSNLSKEQTTCTLWKLCVSHRTTEYIHNLVLFCSIARVQLFNKIMV